MSIVNARQKEYGYRGRHKPSTALVARSLLDIGLEFDGDRTVGVYEPLSAGMMPRALRSRLGVSVASMTATSLSTETLTMKVASESHAPADY